MLRFFASDNRAAIVARIDTWRRSGLGASAQTSSIVDGVWYCAEISGRHVATDLVNNRRAVGTALGYTDLEGEEATAANGRLLRDVVLADQETALRQVVDGLNAPFMFIVCDDRQREVTAVRDHLGLAPLYLAALGEELLLADNLSGLDLPKTPDLDFIAAFMVKWGAPRRGAIWMNGERLPPGSLLKWSAGSTRIERFWDPATLGVNSGIDSREAVGTFRSLFISAVIKSMAGGDATWCHLSGGLDSSSVTAAAAFAHREGLTRHAVGGVLTFSDSLGNGDGISLASAVSGTYGIRHEWLHDFWPWQGIEGTIPPLSSAPDRDYPMFRRDETVSTLIASAGGKVILSGAGPDAYLSSRANYLPELLCQGRVLEFSREALATATARRQTLPQLLVREVCEPLLPKSYRDRRLARRIHVAPWMTHKFVSDHDVRQREIDRTYFPARVRGGHLAATISSLFDYEPALEAFSRVGPFEVRHPLLDRQLVEFCLRLPRVFRVAGKTNKPVLRAALRGITPDAVLDRTDKGAISARFRWALAHERQFLAKLLKNSVLADIGCIEPKSLLRAVDANVSRKGGYVGRLYATLSLETWLSRQLGRIN